MRSEGSPLSAVRLWSENPDVELLLLIAVGIVLVPTLYVSGFHDVPNAVAIPIRTRAVSPQLAIRMAAAFNAVGVLLALPLGIYLYAWFEFPPLDPGLTLSVVLAALLSVLGWNLVTYFQGMPTSTTHALLSALLGGALVAVTASNTDTSELWALPWLTPMITLLLSPLLAFGLAYLLVFLAVRIASGEDPHDVNRVSRGLQSVTVGVASLGMGLQQGQRFSFVLLLALGAAGLADPEAWMGVILVGIALLIGTGALHGGQRIGHTLAHRLVAIDPLRGMVATATSSGLLFIGSLGLALPLSTSLTATSAIMGAGSNQRFATVNWRQIRKIALYWLATPLVCGLSSVILTTCFTAIVG